MALMKDLWHGDIPLVRTYWLFGVLPTIFFNMVFSYIQGQNAIVASRLAAVCFLGMVLIYYIYSGFIYVAIWRSANKYKGMARYAILAKVAVIFGVMALLKAALEIFGAVAHS